MKVVETKFQLRVWNETKKIHRGRTESYKCITNKHQACRTEVNEFTKNALSIIICYQTEIKQNLKQQFVNFVKFYCSKKFFAL